MVNVYVYKESLKNKISALTAEKKSLDERVAELAKSGDQFSAELMTTVSDSVKASADINKRMAQLKEVESKVKDVDAAKVDLERDYAEFLAEVRNQIRVYGAVQADGKMQKVVDAMTRAYAVYEKKAEIMVDSTDKLD